MGASIRFLGGATHGHSAGGGVLGPIPGSNPLPIIHQGMHPESSIHITDDACGSYSYTSRAGSTPKMDFLKFDGVNPRL